MQNTRLRILHIVNALYFEGIITIQARGQNIHPETSPNLASSCETNVESFPSWQEIKIRNFTHIF